MQKFNFDICDHYNYFFYIREHKQSIRAKPRIHARDVNLIHTRKFISWFEKRVSTFIIYCSII